jgi:AraC-like DNA-binding protein
MKSAFQLQDLAKASEVNIDYFDEDIVFINDLKKLDEIKVPARLQMGLLGYCSRGYAEFMLNGVPYELHKNQIFILPSYASVSRLLFSSDFEFKSLFYTDRLLQSLLHDKMELWNDIIYRHRIHVVDLPNDSDEAYGHFFGLLNAFFQQDLPTPFRAEIIQSLLRSAFLSLCGSIKVMLEQSSASPQARKSERPAHSPSQGLLHSFLTLLAQTDIKHRPIAYYADRLFVSPKYLSAICKAESGKTANQWITEYTLEDIRYQLLFTNHSIKEITHQLGFPNTSFFGKYVRQHFGTSPKSLRDHSRKT